MMMMMIMTMMMIMMMIMTDDDEDDDADERDDTDEDEDLPAGVAGDEVPTGREGEAGEVLWLVPGVEDAGLPADRGVAGVDLPEVDVALAARDDAAVLQRVELHGHHGLRGHPGLELPGGLGPVPDREGVLRSILHRGQEDASVCLGEGEAGDRPGDVRSSQHLDGGQAHAVPDTDVGRALPFVEGRTL